MKNNNFIDDVKKILSLLTSRLLLVVIAVITIITGMFLTLHGHLSWPYFISLETLLVFLIYKINKKIHEVKDDEQTSGATGQTEKDPNRRFKKFILIILVFMFFCIGFGLPALKGIGEQAESINILVVIPVWLRWAVGISIVLFLLSKVIYSSMKKYDGKVTAWPWKWIGSILGFVFLVGLITFLIIYWDELGFRKEPTPAPESSVYHQASTPTPPEIHILQFGENYIKPGETWCIIGDQRTRHYALKNTSALRSSVIVKIWSERKGDFEEEFKLITENGMEQDTELYYKIGQMYCSYTHYISVDKEATIIVTDPTQKNM